MFQLHNIVFRKSISDGLFFSVLALLRPLFLKNLAPSILPLPLWKSYYTSQTICGFSIKAQSDWHVIFYSCWLFLHITKVATSFYVPGFNIILSERGHHWNLLFSFSFMILHSLYLWEHGSEIYLIPKISSWGTQSNVILSLI